MKIEHLIIIIMMIILGVFLLASAYYLDLETNKEMKIYCVQNNGEFVDIGLLNDKYCLINNTSYDIRKINEEWRLTK